MAVIAQRPLVGRAKFAAGEVVCGRKQTKLTKGIRLNMGKWLQATSTSLGCGCVVLLLIGSIFVGSGILIRMGDYAATKQKLDGTDGESRIGAAADQSNGDDGGAELESEDAASKIATDILDLPSIPVPEFDLEPLADAMRTWTATTGHTMEGKLVGFESIGNKIRLQRADGKKGTVDLKKLIEEDRQYVLDSKHFLEPAEVLGTYYWNCPARNQRSWWNTRTLIRWGDNYMQVIEVSVGHSTHPDFTAVYLVKRHFDEWKLLEPGDIGAFRVDEEYIVSESMTFSRSQAEAKQMANAGTNGGTQG